jgi:hypothetical protein
MPSLKEATQRPANVGEVIPPATPYTQNVPPIIPREQPGLGPASLGPAPSLWTTGYDSVRQWARPGTSQGRFPALPTKANPQLNAAARSVTTTVVKNLPAGGVTSVGLSMPSIFVVSGSPVTSAGTLAAALAVQTPGTVLAAPTPSLSSLEALSNVAGETTNSFSNSTSPTSATSWGLFVSMSTNPAPPPAGWTDLGGQATLFGKSFTGTGRVTVGLAPGGGLLNSASMLAIFSGSLVSSIQARQATPTSAGSGTLAFTSSNTTGNTLVVVLQAFNSGAPFTLGASDSNGNAYETLSQTVAPFDSVHGVPSCSQIVLVAANCVGGANTVTYEFNGTTHPFFGLKVFIFELSPLPSGTAVPLFRNLTSSDVPSINASKINSGQVSLANGGTASNLQGTGGAHQFVKQSSAGAAFTVGQPDFSDLAGATGQLATNYNGIPLVSNGIPSEVATVDLTGQTAAKATTTLYAVPATGAGQYELSWNAKVTTADAVSSTLGPLTLVYTDPDGVVQTITAPAHSKAGAPETSDTGNSTTMVLLGVPLMLNCKAGTNITYATAYASNTVGTMAYNLHIKLKAL